MQLCKKLQSAFKVTQVFLVRKDDGLPLKDDNHVDV